MKTIDLSSEDVDPPDWLSETSEAAATVLDRLSVTDYELSLHLCNDSRMRELNATYRGLSEPTDVLSFSQAEGDEVPGGTEECLRGDVVISVESVDRNARELGISAREEALRVTVHGLLHLVGYEHTGVTLSDTEAATHPMLALQEEIVNELTKEQNQ